LAKPRPFTINPERRAAQGQSDRAAAMLAPLPSRSRAR